MSKLEELQNLIQETDAFSVEERTAFSDAVRGLDEESASAILHGFQEDVATYQAEIAALDEQMVKEARELSQGFRTLLRNARTFIEETSHKEDVAETSQLLDDDWE